MKEPWNYLSRKGASWRIFKELDLGSEDNELDFFFPLTMVPSLLAWSKYCRKSLLTLINGQVFRSSAQWCCFREKREGRVDSEMWWHERDLLSTVNCPAMNSCWGSCKCDSVEVLGWAGDSEERISLLFPTGPARFSPVFFFFWGILPFHHLRVGLWFILHFFLCMPLGKGPNLFSCV